jgi:hypothetical protein
MNRKPLPQVEPTAEELEFIYSRLEKLSDQEVLENMRGEPCLLRKSGFMKRRQKEFNAAKKVLQEQLKREIDI